MIKNIANVNTRLHIIEDVKVFLEHNNRYMEIVPFTLDMQPIVFNSIPKQWIGNKKTFKIIDNNRKFREFIDHIDAKSQITIADFILKITGLRIMLQCDKCKVTMPYRHGMFIANELLICKKCYNSLYQSCPICGLNVNDQNFNHFIHINENKAFCKSCLEYLFSSKYDDIFRMRLDTEITKKIKNNYHYNKIIFKDNKCSINTDKCNFCFLYRHNDDYKESKIYPINIDDNRDKHGCHIDCPFQKYSIIAYNVGCINYISTLLYQHYDIKVDYVLTNYLFEGKWSVKENFFVSNLLKLITINFDTFFLINN